MNIYTYVPKLLKKANEDPAVLEDVFELTRVLEKQGSYTVSEKGKVGATLIYDDEAFASAHEFASIERQMVAGYVRKGIGGERMVQLLKKLLLTSIVTVGTSNGIGRRRRSFMFREGSSCFRL